ncbi:hypothetical protein BAE30_00055 [Acidithiobacillus caldus]|uniref:Uncharacterized protein n=1 Tax=Acidithiobacillus caldus TaxID=33059 RepID=A0A1E7Z4R3_9PROT|nr:hypothetical protein BAE30_00055 [Acidithiobacillus caldus]
MNQYEVTILQQKDRGLYGGIVRADAGGDVSGAATFYAGMVKGPCHVAAKATKAEVGKKLREARSKGSKGWKEISLLLEDDSADVLHVARKLLETAQKVARSHGDEMEYLLRCANKHRILGGFYLDEIVQHMHEPTMLWVW